MARSGKKRKFRGYDPSKPPAPDKQPDDRVRTSRQPHRRGLAPELRLSDRAESPIGRLWLDKKITYPQLLAGERYCAVVGAYRAVIEAPRSTSGSGRGSECFVVTLNTAEACGDNPDSCPCLRKRFAYNDAFCALKDTHWGRADGRLVRIKPHRVVLVVSRVVIYREAIEEQDLVYLVAGLNALDRLWA